MIELFENEINMKNEEGNTPLHYACIRGNLEVVKLLNSKGAQMSERNTAFLTPLMLSIYYSHFFVVHYLLSIEQVVDFVTNATIIELYRVLQFAITSVSSQIFFLLVEVFAFKIDEISERRGSSFWDIKFNNLQSQIMFHSGTQQVTGALGGNSYGGGGAAGVISHNHNNSQVSK